MSEDTKKIIEMIMARLENQAIDLQTLVKLNSENRKNIRDLYRKYHELRVNNDLKGE